MLEQAFLEYGLTTKSSKHLIVQSDNKRVWPVIFRQTFDLSKEELNVRFAGEAGLDNGGPFREFLCQAKKLLPEISCMFFGEKKSICLTNDPSSLIGNHYFVVGQLVGMSVLKINRGPECIHPTVVHAMFNIEQPLELETVEDEMLNSIIDSIEEGSFDALLEANINPFGKSAKELIQLYYLSHVILTKFSAIEQFKSGIASIYPGFYERTS